MYYEITKPWLHLRIDNTFHDKTVLAVLEFYKQSKKNRYLFMQRDAILVNGVKAHLQQQLQIGDTLSLCVFQPEEDPIQAKHKPIKVVYEDDFILVVNKDPHILIHSDGRDEATLCNFVKAYFNISQQTCAVRPIHRLDKETSGLLMFCKCSFFQPFLDDALRTKDIHREYLAVVDGNLTPHKKIIIDQPLGRDRHDAKKYRVSKHGNSALTIVECTKQYKSCSVVKCTLKTGRTHQIRIHLAHIGHPIISDPLYGKRDQKMKRLALHAFRLSWNHPITFQEIKVTCDTPEDITNYIKKAHER